MKKLILCILLYVIPGFLAGQETELKRQTVRRVGNFQAEQLYPGILPALIFEEKNTVLALPDASFDAPLDNLSHTPSFLAAVRRAQELTYHYFVQAWQDWRAAANAYLPADYQLPSLSFLLAQNTQQKASAGALPVHLVTRFPSHRLEHLGQYTASSIQRIELVLPIHLLKYWAFSDPDPLQQALMTGDLRNVICDLTSGWQRYWDLLVIKSSSLEDVSWANRYRTLTKKEEDCLNTLMTLPAEEWGSRGPFAAYNKHIMTHEWGHLLGFGHIDNSIMSTGGAADRSLIKPNKLDGLRLAVLVCWHHNQKAGKTVCVPQVKNATAAAEK